MLFRSGVDDGENDLILTEIVILINAAVLFELGPSRPKFRGRSRPSGAPVRQELAPWWMDAFELVGGTVSPWRNLRLGELPLSSSSRPFTGPILKSAQGVRRERRRFSGGCKSHPAKRSSRKQPEQSWRQRMAEAFG